MRPFYDLIANIAAEEYGHIELVAYTINLLLTGATTRGDRSRRRRRSRTRPMPATATTSSPAARRPCRSTRMGNPWNGRYVFSSGNLKLDLLHNFFLECGARANKIRVYEMADDPTARAMVGYLLVRGGVHIVAYAKALEKLTGVDVGKLLPIPDISNKQFPEARKHEEKGCTRSCTASAPTTTSSISQIWNGPHPEDGSELRVVDGPPEGGPVPMHPEEPQLTSPIGPDGIDRGMLTEVAARLFGKS